MDTVSNGGFLPFSAGAMLSPLPSNLARQYGPAIMTCDTTSPRNSSINCRENSATVR
jgi:hypothetical protein